MSKLTARQVCRRWSPSDVHISLLLLISELSHLPHGKLLLDLWDKYSIREAIEAKVCSCMGCRVSVHCYNNVGCGNVTRRVFDGKNICSWWDFCKAIMPVLIRYRFPSLLPYFMNSVGLACCSCKEYRYTCYARFLWLTKAVAIEIIPYISFYVIGRCCRCGGW